MERSERTESCGLWGQRTDHGCFGECVSSKDMLGAKPIGLNLSAATPKDNMGPPFLSLSYPVSFTTAPIFMGPARSSLRPHQSSGRPSERRKN
ncbi:hypothetical protein H6P81_018834 [Aristolochia fimbriata]|uniref:Uncharacterized protein n=1 Tax=Aristolochia fimbriata TaxID=158543 RepID=A0AAV7E242_ARIFI|nr:hypothetical protein H6P81_018834 [Aristolochia fimbriata]